MPRSGQPPHPNEGEAAPLVARVFAELADGHLHSGAELARALGVSRSAIGRAAATLADLGAELHVVRNRGYQLTAATEPLAAVTIRGGLAPEVRDHVRRVEVTWSTASTNAVLLARPHPPAGASEVFLAEYQSAGRGRRGRAWLAPPGGAICLSMSWTFREVPRDLGALSLVVGVCALRALGQLGVSDMTLKWPNDLLIAGRKLGGVLIELRADSTGPACVVIGIGLNVALSAPLLQQIAAAGAEATDLKSAGLAVSRNQLAAGVVSACLSGLMAFEHQGLKPFIEEWRSADALRGRPVDVAAAAGTTRGLACGIDVHGALLLETREGVRRFIAGEVTVRAAG